jgi:hypothetical protein
MSIEDKKLAVARNDGADALLSVMDRECLI